MTYNDILNIKNLRKREKELRTHYTESLRIPHCDTGRKSIITEDEFKKYVEIFVEYDLKFKLFPKNHPSFPGIPMARTIRDYFDYSAKVHGFTTYSEFVRWKYNDGPWKPSEVIHYFEYKYNS